MVYIGKRPKCQCVKVIKNILKEILISIFVFDIRFKKMDDCTPYLSSLYFVQRRVLSIYPQDIRILISLKS